MYNARVKAFNSFCEGEYSATIGLHTAEGKLRITARSNLQFSVPKLKKNKITNIFHLNAVAWFTFDPALSDANGSGLAFSNDLSTVSVDGWDHRVALGSVGFSRGIHYWEFTINKYTPDTDPTFGIARIDVARDQMLGKSIRMLVIN